MISILAKNELIFFPFMGRRMERLLNNIKELQGLLREKSLTAQQDKEIFAELCILETIRKEFYDKFIVQCDQEISYGSYFGID